MRITSGIIFFLILLYPFFYANSLVASSASYTFSLFYFLPLTLLFFLLNFGKKSIQELKKNRVNLFLLGCVFIIILLNTNDIRYLKPLLFIVYLINLYLLSLTINFKENEKLIKYAFVSFVILSVLYLGYSHRYLDGDRYFAFLISPTVYSVYAEVFLILLIYIIKKPSVKFVVFVIAGIFIVISKTRLNLVFYISIPFLIYLLENVKVSKLRVVLVYIFCLNMLYPIYSFLVQFDFGKKSLVSSRYESGRDSSFGLRNHINYLVYNEYLNKTSVGEKLFGKGSEEARKLVLKKIKYDIFPHNDFIRLAYDFGIICTILFLFFLYRISRINNVSFLILLLYLFSFYHNMVYDFFLISILVFYSGIKHKNEIVKELPS
ncbi:MAG: hypothetical protein ACK50L_05175 [Bacteroidota bacterium]